MSKTLEQLEREENAAWISYEHALKSFVRAVFVLPE